MRYAVVVALCFIGTIGQALLSNAWAWDFRMVGAFNYVYEYFDQKGDQGFFGRFDVDRSVAAGGLAAGDFATLNGWMGGQIGHQGN